MAKKVNITDKLSFDENPVIVINGEEMEVNSDAETMLRLMGAFGSMSEIQAVNEAMELLFKPEDVEKIMAIKKNGNKLSAKSLMVIIQESMNLVMGDSEGE